ncbi:MAG: thermonuclease family protein [Nitrobacter sp.]|uniref:thermonuclease family protein n=1 Tax=Nitrobacter sp. TaxID=29420 RepID=UPI0026390DB6|nr:thermonuclease family protein [Nitrobacter sp.]MCV0387865.1 thermonuclease family protein [Nitrobacter sp.]
MKNVLFLMMAVMAVPEVAFAQTFEGTAEAVDGDTIDMTGLRIRLLHIDAPEAEQRCSVGGVPWNCGTDASAVLTSFLDGQSISCVSTGRDVYGRYLATCHTRIMDVGEQMVAQGLAIADPDAPESYQVANDRAKSLKLGLWNSEFQLPREWRAANRPDPIPTREPRAMAAAQRKPARSFRNDFGCAIKGNRSRRGDWIYHLPGQQYYDQTRPEELFCSEADARAAGYRRSKV